MPTPIRSALALLALVLVAGCRADSYQSVPRAALESPIPSNRSRIVVIRAPQTISSERSLQVLDGETEVGRLAPGQYLSWSGTPGRRLIELRFPKPELTGGHVWKFVTHEGAPGRTTYYAVTINTKVKGPISLLAPEDYIKRADFDDPLGTPLAIELSASEAQALLAESSPAPER